MAEQEHWWIELSSSITAEVINWLTVELIKWLADWLLVSELVS